MLKVLLISSLQVPIRCSIRNDTFKDGNREILSRVWGVRDLLRRVLDWMIEFIDTLFTQTARSIGNTALSLFYALYSSPLHTHWGSQSSLDLILVTDF
jgi:hypothetical protein